MVDFRTAGVAMMIASLRMRFRRMPVRERTQERPAFFHMIVSRHAVSLLISTALRRDDHQYQSDHDRRRGFARLPALRATSDGIGEAPWRHKPLSCCGTRKS